MSYIRAFGLFLWDFVVGDAPELAIGVPALLALSMVLTRAHVAAAFIVPAAVAALLAMSVQIGRRASR